ncbi:MAG: SusD/RagB family nutrient-binding outer membrane lipoprotein [Ginsengibacter sp.]
MKYFNHKLYIASLLLAVVIMSSCTKKFFYDDINDDPTQLKDPTPSLMLAPIILASGYEYGGDESRFPSIFMQQVTGDANQSFSAGIYNISPDDVDNMWSFGFYSGLMNNDYDLIKISSSLNQHYYHAVGQILMANFLQRATDLWGDIPYTEAFKGNESKNASFDSQESIYQQIFTLLNSSITEIEGGDDGASVPGSDDYIYSGDMAKWEKLAHALKARCFIHLVKVNAAYYDSAINEIPKAFTSNADNAIVPFSGSSVNSSNPTFQFNDQRGDITYGGYLQTLLKNAGDPRFDVYYNPANPTLLGDFYGAANSPVPLMTFYELKFIEAEAQFQKGNKDAAAAAYNSAVEANLNYTVGNSGYASTVAKTASNITLNDIMIQKYIALFLRAESWTDWRRTGIPNLTGASGNVTGGVIPRALIYPSGEIKYNNKTPTGRTLTSKLWWDK